VTHLARTLDEIMAAGGKVVSGEQSFDLYATYGLPLEITRDIAREQNIGVDEEGFQQAMEAHRIASGAGAALQDVQEVDLDVYRALRKELQDGGKLSPEGVVNDPYSALTSEGPLLALLIGSEVVKKAKKGDRVSVVLPQTSFYVEAGGQVMDMGKISAAGEPSWEIRVDGVSQPVSGLILHVGEVIVGNPTVGDAAVATVDGDLRWDIMRNHTATHLLHASLRAVLGEHARQAGSLVAPERLRFDFTHPKALTPDEIRNIEDGVNNSILANHQLEIRHQSRKEAESEGAIALFGETYGDNVRTVGIGVEERVSLELCGGTHVPSTGLIGPFVIVSEGSVAAGIRRIEALTGRKALELIQARMQGMARMADKLHATPETVEARLDALLEERDRLAAETADRRQDQALKSFKAVKSQAKNISGIAVCSGQIPNADADTLRSLIDQFRAQNRLAIAVLTSTYEGRALIVGGASTDLGEIGLFANDLVRSIAEDIGGRGGGTATLAQAGGMDASRLAEVPELVNKWVEKNAPT
jgi:alanyl-tRNA synthetase